MGQPIDDHESSIAFANMALAEIESRRLIATPRNYEIWFVYVTRHNSSLNQALDETLARNGRLTETDLEQIHNSYLSQGRTTERLDEIGSRVIREIDDVMTLIADALGMTANFNNDLSGESQKLSLAGNPDQVKTIVERLVASTREIREANNALEDRLNNSKLEINHLQQNLEAIRAESLTDPLTELGNRKYFDRTIGAAAETAFATGGHLSLLMIDIDHFKSFNDKYGHLTGDQVLRLVGVTLRQGIADKDSIARYGGEEFAVVLPDATLRQAIEIAETLRRAVMAKDLKKKSTGEILGRITISAGISTLRPGEATDSLIERADACLYAAKRNGRNRVVCEADPEHADEQSHVA